MGDGAYANAPQDAAEKPAVAIICGGGAFPEAVVKAVLKQGRGVYLFLLRGFADPALERYPHEWLKVGSMGKYVAANRKMNLKEIVFIGSLVRPRVRELGLDWETLKLIPRVAKLYLGGDSKLLSGVADIFVERGYVLRGAHEVAPEILIPEGLATNTRPDAREEEDIALGADLLRTIDRFDVGQAVIVAGRRVVAIEGPEGTAGMLERVAHMRRSGRLRLKERDGVLVKIPKPSQDRRIDLPAIGADTLDQAKAAGLAGVAVEALGTIVVDAQKFVEAADVAGLFVVALPPGKRAGA